MNGQTGQLLVFGVLIVVVVLLMMRNGRKRQRDQAALSQGLVPGAEVMTTFGVYGTIESIDDAENRIVLRTGPSSEMTVHRQAVRQVVPKDAAPADAKSDAAPARLDGEPVVLDDAAADPEFGQRVDRPAAESVSLDKPVETPVRRTGGGGTGAKAE